MNSLSIKLILCSLILGLSSQIAYANAFRFSTLKFEVSNVVPDDNLQAEPMNMFMDFDGGTGKLTLDLSTIKASTFTGESYQSTYKIISNKIEVSIPLLDVYDDNFKLTAQYSAELLSDPIEVDGEYNFNIIKLDLIKTF